MSDGMCWSPPDRTVQPMEDPQPITRRYDSSLPCGCDRTRGTLCTVQEANRDRKDRAYEQLIDVRERMERKHVTSYEWRELRADAERIQNEYDEATEAWKDHWLGESS